MLWESLLGGASSEDLGFCFREGVAGPVARTSAKDDGWGGASQYEFGTTVRNAQVIAAQGDDEIDGSTWRVGGTVKPPELIGESLRSGHLCQEPVASPTLGICLRSARISLPTSHAGPDRRQFRQDVHLT